MAKRGTFYTPSISIYDGIPKRRIYADETFSWNYSINYSFLTPMSNKKEFFLSRQKQGSDFI